MVNTNLSDRRRIGLLGLSLASIQFPEAEKVVPATDAPEMSENDLRSLAKAEEKRARKRLRNKRIA